jgi:hypothetical protein
VADGCIAAPVAAAQGDAGVWLTPLRGTDVVAGGRCGESRELTHDRW